MSSKLDYLAKYTDKGISGEQKKDSKKKKSKKKKSKKGEVRSRAAERYTSTVIDMDVDDAWMQHQDNENEVVEEGPVIVSGHQWKDEVGDFESDSSPTTGKDKLNISSRRHDSSDDEVVSSRRQRHDSSEDEGWSSRRRRHDSSDEEDISGNRKYRRRRHDSSDEEDNSDNKMQTKRRERDLSEDESEVERSIKRPAKMLSGHSAGLQNAASFSKAERKIQEKKMNKLTMMKDSGRNSETVYRDKDGKKVDMVAKFEEHQREKAEKDRVDKEEKANIQKGFVQKLEEQALKRDEEMIKNAPFARSRNDEELDSMLKDKLRAEGECKKFTRMNF